MRGELAVVLIFWIKYLFITRIWTCVFSCFGGFFFCFFLLTFTVCCCCFCSCLLWSHLPILWLQDSLNNLHTTESKGNVSCQVDSQVSFVVDFKFLKNISLSLILPEVSQSKVMTLSDGLYIFYIVLINW